MHAMRTLLLALAFLLGGCAASPAAGPPRPARICHIVLITLHDKADLPALQAECDRDLAAIPGVTCFAAGPHIDTGRPTVLTDYHLALVIGFETADDYAVYVAHPLHTTLVERWKPRIASLRVYDILDETP